MSASILTYPRESILAELPLLTEAGSVLLMGPPGTGKTWLAAKLAENLGVPFYKFASHPDALATDLTLAYMPRVDGTWGPVPGPYAHAAGHGPRFGFDTKPGVLGLDDFHEAGPGMMAAAYTAADVGSSWLSPVDGAMLRPTDGYRCVLTTNAPDPESLPPAIKDRIAAIVPVLVPSEDAFATLHPELQELASWDYDNNPKPVVTFRQYQHVSRYWPTLGLARATLLAMGSADRAKKMLLAMATFEIDDAITAVQALYREGTVTREELYKAKVAA